MVDKHVQGLIERVIDSPLKLQLLLHFCEHRHVQGTAYQIAQRIYRDIWSTREALAELAEDGILSYAHNDAEPVYVYRPHAELLETINRLCQMYNEPIERDSVQKLVRDASAYASYRRTPASAFESERYSFAV